MEDISNNFHSEIEKIMKDEKLEKQIKWQMNEITKYEKEIKDWDKEIDSYHQEEIKIIYDLRAIMENEEYHENSLICNDLKKNDKRKYEELTETLYKNLEDNAKLEIEKRNKILDKINKIEKAKEDIRDIKYAKNKKIKAEIEKTIYKILIKYSNYLYDNEKNKRLIDIIKEEINKNEK
jgi:hypothetical protein